MKQADIVQTLAREFGTKDIAELNRILRSKAAMATKFRIHGKNLRSLGYTVAIKMISADGLRIFDVNRVTQIRFDDIDNFVKAPPKEKREKTASTTPASKPPTRRASKETDVDDDDEYDDDDLENFDEVDTELAEAFAKSKKSKKKPARGGGDHGSKFIPAKKPGKR